MGVFDGVHLGHGRILKETVKMAQTVGADSIVVTFYPHPQNEESLYSLEHRLKLIAEYGIKTCVVLKFTPHFSKMHAEDFIKDILADKLKAKFILVGRNFRFGADASGDLTALNKIARDYGISVKGFDIVKIRRKAISSTLIRSMIKKGILNDASRMLGRPVTVLGTVIKGSSVARRLGYPTANIDPHHEVIPPAGIYAVNVLFNGRRFKGVCYIGTKPTFSHINKMVHIEVHILNFAKNIYGQLLDIQFIKLIRPDEKFKSPQLLAAAIRKDILRAKHILSSC